MAVERIRIPVAYLDSGMGTDPLHPKVSVPASGIHDHMAETYGLEVPHDPVLRVLSETACNSITAYSTDEQLDNLRSAAYLRHFIRLATPLVISTDVLGHNVGIRLGEIESMQPPAPRDRQEDLAYGVGLFIGASVVCAAVLEIPHPHISGERDDPGLPPVTPGYRAVEPSVNGNPSLLNMLLGFGQGMDEEKAELHQLRQTARGAGERAEEYLIRWSIAGNT